MPITETQVVQHIGPNPKAPMPHQFFKYRSLVGDSRRFTRDLILRQRLYFASPTELNDPFEFWPVLDFTATPAERRRYLFRMVNHQLPSASQTEREQWVARVEQGQWQSAVEAAHRVTMDQIGVFSMTAKPADILMWPHYADSHRGVCVRLELEHLFNADLKPFPVEYYRARPVHNPVTDGVMSMLEKHALSKAIDWHYEEEWRLVRNGGARTIHEFVSPVVSAVILGARTSPDDRSEILSWVDECGHPMEVFEARYHHRDYAIALNRIR